MKGSKSVSFNGKFSTISAGKTSSLKKVTALARFPVTLILACMNKPFIDTIHEASIKKSFTEI